MTDLVVKASMLDDAIARLRDAAATCDLGRSFPEVMTITDAGETVRTYFESIQIACEALAQTARHTADAATEIHLSFTETDTALSRHHRVSERLPE